MFRIPRRRTLEGDYARRVLTDYEQTDRLSPNAKKSDPVVRPRQSRIQVSSDSTWIVRLMRSVL
jgi:DNA-directed RNA polymerase subunit H (RpoH/RPB5)